MLPTKYINILESFCLCGGIVFLLHENNRQPSELKKKRKKKDRMEIMYSNRKLMKGLVYGIVSLTAYRMHLYTATKEKNGVKAHVESSFH